MKHKHRWTQHVRNTTAAVVALALAASATLISVPAAAQNAYQQVCIDAWEDAPAYDYCNHQRTSVHREEAGNCKVTNPSCTITVSTASGNTTTYNVSKNHMTQSPAITDDITLCWAIREDGSYNPRLTKTGCSASEITLDTATTTGLP